MFPDLKSNCSSERAIKQSFTHRVNCAMCWRISKVKSMSAVRVMIMIVMWWGLKAGYPSSMGGGQIRASLPNKQAGVSPTGMVKEPKNRVVCKNTASRSGSALNRVQELQFDWMVRKLPTRTCQDTQRFPYPHLPSSSTAFMGIRRHGILITTQTVIHKQELVAIPSLLELLA